AAGLFDRPAGRLAGTALADLLVPAHRSEFLAAMGRMAANGRTEGVELTLLRGGGRTVWATLTLAPPATQKGAREGRVALVDGPEQVAAQRAAQRLVAIVASSVDAIVSLDRNARVTSWNAAAEALFGIPANDMLGQLLDRITPAPRRAEERQM